MGFAFLAFCICFSVITITAESEFDTNVAAPGSIEMFEALQSVLDDNYEMQLWLREYDEDGNETDSWLKIEDYGEGE